MPATTPVYSGLAPCNWARIMSCPGPRPPCNTPRISTCMGSGLVPVKTVHAVAVMPRGTSLRGKKPPLEGGGPAAAPEAVWAGSEAVENAATRVIASAATRCWISFTRFPTSIRVQPAVRRLGRPKSVNAVGARAQTCFRSARPVFRAGSSLMLLSTEVVMSTMVPSRLSFHRILPALRVPALCLLVALAAAPLGRAQNPVPTPPPQPQPDQAAPDSGGPGADNAAIALPKKKDDADKTPPPAPVAPKFKNPEGMPAYSLRIEVPEVTVDVGVLLEKTHQFVPNLKPRSEEHTV